MRELPEFIIQILDAGNQAPSGENCQPWRFVVRDREIEAHVDPMRDSSYYNWGQRASLMAVGAAIENMMVAAPSAGMRPKLAVFPSNDEHHAATLALHPDPSIETNALADEISKRVTNRKRYAEDALSDAHQAELLATACGGVDIHLTTKRSDIQALARVATANEEIMLSNKAIHRFFFSHVSWTKEEDDKRRAGFYIKTLELPAGAAIAFRQLRRWSVIKGLLKVGVHRLIGLQNASTYAAAGAFGAISVRGESPEEFFEAGRVMQRLWLTASRQGYMLQPLTGVLFFKLKCDKGEGNVFLSRQCTLIERHYETARQVFNAHGRRLVFMFRIGRGEPPSARSSRFALTDSVAWSGS